MMAKRITVLAALLVLASSAIVASAQQQPRSQDQMRLITYDGDMTSLLALLAADYKVEVGLETIALEPRPRIKIRLEFATLADVMDAIVAANPRYLWRANDGFIDVYPRTGGCQLLETTINEFHVDNTDWSLATQILTSLPEVQSKMLALHLNRRDLPKDTRESTVNVVSITLKDVTLRRALHEITKASGRNFWIFEQPRGASQVFSISDSAR